MTWFRITRSDITLLNIHSFTPGFYCIFSACWKLYNLSIVRFVSITERLKPEARDLIQGHQN